MTTFILVTHKANFTKPVVTSYADDAALKAAEAALKSGTEYLVFTGNNKELNELKVEEIVKLFNAIAPKGVAKVAEFHDRAAAETALAARLVEVAKAPKAAGAPRGKQPGPLNLAHKITPVRANSSLGVLLTLMLEGKHTVDDLAAKSGIAPGVYSVKDKVLHRIRHQLAVKHGIGHTVNEAGIITATVPDGHTVDALFITPKAKADKPPSDKTAKAEKTAAAKAAKEAKVAKAAKEAAAKEAKVAKAAAAKEAKAAKAAAAKAAAQPETAAP